MYKNKRGTAAISYILLTLLVCVVAGLAFYSVSQKTDETANTTVSTLQSEDACMLARGEWNSETKECNSSNEVKGNTLPETPKEEEKEYYAGCGYNPTFYSNMYEAVDAGVVNLFQYYEYDSNGNSIYANPSSNSGKWCEFTPDSTWIADSRVSEYDNSGILIGGKYELKNDGLKIIVAKQWDVFYCYDYSSCWGSPRSGNLTYIEYDYSFLGYDYFKPNKYSGTYIYSNYLPKKLANDKFWPSIGETYFNSKKNVKAKLSKILCQEDGSGTSFKVAPSCNMELYNAGTEYTNGYVTRWAVLVDDNGNEYYEPLVNLLETKGKVDYWYLIDE